MNDFDLSPLPVGSLALRPKFAYRESRPHVIGFEAVRVVAVAGDLVTWENGRTSKFKAGAYRHTSNRRELIALSALENLTAALAEKSAVNSTLAGASEATLSR